jgi:hypothetical protein
MLVDNPDHELLAALQEGKLTAIRNGEEIRSIYWFGKDVRDLTDDLRFRRAEAIGWWSWRSPKNDGLASTTAAGVADQKADPAAAPRPRALDSTVRDWYEGYVKGHVDNGTTTSEEDDWAAAKEKFGDRARQNQIRKLRPIVPAAWRKQGRRPKHTTNTE